jgi:hypothetical protein
MSRIARLTTLIGTAALALAIAAPVAAADDAMVRVLHASPDAPAVDVKVDGANVLTNVPFKTISDYLTVPGGTYNIKVCATGTDTCVIDANLTFAAGTKYTVAATTNLASIEAQVITDAPAPTESKTQARVVHFSADTPAVDVLTQDGSAKVVENLAYPNATGYLTLDPGSYDLKVCATADNTVCPLDPPALDLASGTSYSVFAVGSLEGQTLDAVVAVDAVAAPSTDTVAADGAGTGGMSLGVLGALALFGISTVAVIGRLATRRSEM